MSKYDVFISCSHSHRDQEFTQSVCHFLEENEIQYWPIQKEIGVGEMWAETIIEAIRESSVIIVLFSERYNNSPSCENEIELSVKYNKPIIALITDGCELSQEKTYLLRKSGWIYYIHDIDEWEERLLQTIKNYRHHDDIDDWISDIGNNNSSHLNYIQLKDRSKKERPQRSQWKVKSIGNGDKAAILKLSSYVPGYIYLDGKYICEIGTKEIVKIPLDQGAYIVCLEEKNNPQSYKMIGVDIPTGSYSKAIVIGLQNSEGIKDSIKKTKRNREEVKCFIAGSKEMMEERNAMRAVASNMYLNWKSFNFLIEVYSFDNFERAISETGHQEEYNQFIANDADLVLFLFDNQVGKISLKELDIAIESYKHKKHPKIIVYVKKAKEYSPVIEKLKKRLAKEDVYWVDYISIEHLSSNFERDLNAQLFRRVHIE